MFVYRCAFIRPHAIYRNGFLPLEETQSTDDALRALRAVLSQFRVRIGTYDLSIEPRRPDKVTVLQAHYHGQLRGVALIKEMDDANY